MDMNKIIKSARWMWSPLAVIAVTTVFSVVISLLCLSSGYFIVFQNCFYIPIVLACLHYTKRGFLFSVVLACFYFCLIASFTHRPTTLLEAFIRALVFIVIAGIISYLSSKRRLAEAVSAYAKEWQNTFDAISDAVWLLDPDNRILKSNRAAESMFRLKPDQMIGRLCYEVVHGTDKP